MSSPALDVLQMRLDGIAQSMQETLFRTAVSPVVREGADAACALFTVDGELLALSEAIPLLLGALPGAVSAILSRYPATIMSPGDLYCMNDPFAGGTHLPDISVLLPVFAGDTLVAFAASILHHQDVGGMRPGSVPPDATDIYQEGLRLPPMRLGRNGVVAPELAGLIEANSRTPAIVLGDLRAQIAAATRAARAIGSIVAEHGAGAFIAASRACLDRAETQIRALLDALPDGPYDGCDGLDPTPGLPDVVIKVRITCVSRTLLADFTGTSPQVAAPINCVRSGPLSAVFYALLSLAPPGTLRNGGILRAVSLVLPEGSVVNASPPAAVNARMGLVRATTSAVLQAVAQAVPDRMPAANSGMSYVLAFSGQHADGRPFLSTEIIAGGAGGGPFGPGADSISTDVGNAMNMPAEALEQMAPIRLCAAAVRHGSGGSGRYRGGNGIRREYEALADDISVSLRGERFARVPPGLLGGGSPQPSRAFIVRTDGEEVALSARSAFKLNAGDRLIVESCGGAGYGEPG
jgi:N-methylhydantoinase B